MRGFRPAKPGGRRVRLGIRLLSELDRWDGLNPSNDKFEPHHGRLCGLLSRVRACGRVSHHRLRAHLSAFLGPAPTSSSAFPYSGELRLAVFLGHHARPLVAPRDRVGCCRPSPVMLMLSRAGLRLCAWTSFANAVWVHTRVPFAVLGGSSYTPYRRRPACAHRLFGRYDLCDERRFSCCASSFLRPVLVYLKSSASVDRWPDPRRRRASRA
jgi:hypothetical protein